MTESTVGARIPQRWYALKARLLGLDRIGAPPAAHARLRGAYRAVTARS